MYLQYPSETIPCQTTTKLNHQHTVMLEQNSISAYIFYYFLSFCTRVMIPFFQTFYNNLYLQMGHKSVLKYYKMGQVFVKYVTNSSPHQNDG